MTEATRLKTEPRYLVWVDRCSFGGQISERIEKATYETAFGELAVLVTGEVMLRDEGSERIVSALDARKFSRELLHAIFMAEQQTRKLSGYHIPVTSRLANNNIMVNVMGESHEFRLSNLRKEQGCSRCRSYVMQLYVAVKPYRDGRATNASQMRYCCDCVEQHLSSDSTLRAIKGEKSA